MPLSGLMDQLLNLSSDPVVYSIVFFIYTVAATVILPIPVELGLFFSHETPIWLKALVLGAGKAVGSTLVFTLGGKLESPLDRLASSWKWFRSFVDIMQKFVGKTRYYGLYLILSIPLMVDTVPIYIFAVFNKEGTMTLRNFALTNFFAGITRATVVYAVFYMFNIQLV